MNIEASSHNFLCGQRDFPLQPAHKAQKYIFRGKAALKNRCFPYSSAICVHRRLNLFSVHTRAAEPECRKNEASKIYQT